MHETVGGGPGPALGDGGGDGFDGCPVDDAQRGGRELIVEGAVKVRVDGHLVEYRLGTHTHTQSYVLVIGSPRREPFPCTLSFG